MEADEIISKYIESLSKKISLEKVIIFGSTARGNRLEESDIDIIVVSNDFKNMPLNERFRIVYTSWPPNIDADIIPLTEKELEKALKKSIVLKDARKYWIEIKTKPKR